MTLTVGDRFAAVPGMTLTGWISAPSASTGVAFYREGAGWERRSYDELAQMALAVAERIAESGAPAGSVVALLAGAEPAFVSGFFGALLAGVAPSPLPLPIYLGDGAERQLGAQLDALRPAAVLHGDAPLPGFAPSRRAQTPVLALNEVPVGGSTREFTRSDPCGVVQFTSGSTGEPQPVAISRSAIEQQLGRLAESHPVGPGEAIASWLPLHHDMGLIGTFLYAVINQRDLWLMAPESFIRRPIRWLECFAAGAVATAAPGFAYAYACRRTAPEELARLELSGWRSAIVGGERIDVPALARAWRELGTRGLPATTLTAAYGMVETTLITSIGRPDEELSAVSVPGGPAIVGAPLRIARHGRLTSLDPEAGPWLSTCGRPLPHTDVVIAGPDGTPLPDGHVGEVVVRSPALADGAAGADGRLWTGDAACRLDGELYVLGRLGDSISLRGRVVLCEELEAQVVSAAALSAGRTVALAGGTLDGTEIILVVESPPGPWAQPAASMLRRTAGEGCRLRVLATPAGTILRTSSGKPRRRAMWQQHTRGELVGELLFDSGH